MSKLRKPTSNFTMVPNALLRDKSISLKAKGIYALLHSKPDDWTYIESNLVEESNDGRESFRSGLKELCGAGWLTKEQVVDEKGRFSHNDLRLHDRKQKPDDVSAVDVKPDDGQSPTTNTEIQKLNNQDLVPPEGAPQRTKATSREHRGQRLDDYLANLNVIALGRTQIPIEWEQWAERQFSWRYERIFDTAAKFCDYWRSVAGQRGRHLDWFATWRNWCRREAERGPSQSRGSSAGERNARNAVSDALGWAQVAAESNARQSAGGAGGHRDAGSNSDPSPDGSGAIDVTGHGQHW